jgi:hypothetical protein
MEPPRREVNFEMKVEPDQEGGVYANFLNVWHSEHEFTFDFVAMQPPVVPDDPEAPVTIPCRVVARVRIPPTLVFAILQAVNSNMTRYEEVFGEIRRPQPPQESSEE